MFRRQNFYECSGRCPLVPDSAVGSIGVGLEYFFQAQVVIRSELGERDSLQTGL